VRQGGNWQNFVVVLKIAAIVALIAASLSSHSHVLVPSAGRSFDRTTGLIAAIGVAMLPVLFTYAGFQSPSFVTGETLQPQWTLPRGLIIGFSVVVAIYVLANIGYLKVLGAGGLAGSAAPAADAMRAVAGNAGARFIALAIALSTLGYLSTCMLTFPRVYYQMAADGLFFKALARISPSTHVPIVAILLHAFIASIITLSGTYEQIINWVVAPQWLFIFMAGGALFVFRRRDAALPKPVTTVPGHPVTTLFFIAVLLAIFCAELLIYPLDTLYGIGVVVTGAVVYLAWQARRATA
jgi:APA family basic amino acid/polyamine antiporter